MYINCKLENYQLQHDKSEAGCPTSSPKTREAAFKHLCCCCVAHNNPLRLGFSISILMLKLEFGSATVCTRMFQVLLTADLALQHCISYSQ